MVFVMHMTVYIFTKIKNQPTWSTNALVCNRAALLARSGLPTCDNEVEYFHYHKVNSLQNWPDKSCTTSPAKVNFKLRGLGSQSRLRGVQLWTPIHNSAYLWRHGFRWFMRHDSENNLKHFGLLGAPYGHLCHFCLTRYHNDQKGTGIKGTSIIVRPHVACLLGSEVDSGKPSQARTKRRDRAAR